MVWFGLVQVLMFWSDKHGPINNLTEFEDPINEDDLTQNGRRPHQNWKATSPKMEDELTQNGRRLHPKWRTTSPKMEGDLTKNGRRLQP